MSRRAKTSAATGLLVLALSPLAAAQDPVPVDPTVTIQAPGSEAGAAATTPTPTATATPTPSPTPESEPELDFGSYDEARPPKRASKEVKRIYRDFRKDSLISSCRHTLEDLRETRETMPATFEHDFPDFLPTLQAAIDERRALSADKCAQKRAEEDATDNAVVPTPTPTATPTATPTPTATATPAPTATAAPSAKGDPLKSVGKLPDVASNNAPAPLPPATTPAPVATPPTPPPAPPAAAAPAPEAEITREPAAAPAPVWGMAAGGGLLALGGLLAPLAGARPGSRLAGFRHSWGEAGFRLRGMWLDFLDWLRVGR
ncbi:MAG: hypothetical protein M3P40_02555 [Actinomycetota bacterium]|nr:hypothetical protein [Actinomycetota bacterium]